MNRNKERVNTDFQEKVTCLQGVVLNSGNTRTDFKSTHTGEGKIPFQRSTFSGEGLHSGMHLLKVISRYGLHLV